MNKFATLFTLEHGKAAYRADFAFYGATIAGLAVLLVVYGPSDQRIAFAGLLLAGIIAWSAIEYALHRFILHGLEPFRHWHALHHARPEALICAPTALSAGLSALLIFLPACAMIGLWHACALTLGVLVGYLAYSVTHHAIHHWQVEFRWLQRRKHWHALHHQLARRGCYGVTSGVWDRLLGSTPESAPLRSVF